MRLRPLPPLICLAFAACGDYPQPFRLNPGATAARLSQPPPARLDVVVPTNALLGDAGSAAFASALASRLRDLELPAETGEGASDWRVTTRAEAKGGQVIPVYAVVDPSGTDAGHVDGTPVPASTWAMADPPTLDRVAAEAAPRVSDLLTSIKAARIKTDPKSLYNRPAIVFVAPVTGAPGDGNTALTAQMRKALGGLGPVVQDTQAGADFAVRGTVESIPAGGGQVQVVVKWAMTDAAGHDLGAVLQVNNVPPETISRFWGDVAVVVAEEAAHGVREAILRQSGRAPEDAPAEPTGAPSPPAS